MFHDFSVSVKEKTSNARRIVIGKSNIVFIKVKLRNTVRNTVDLHKA